MQLSLIIFSGFPGAGKSSVAESVAQKLSIPIFAKDKLEARIVRSKLTDITSTALGFAGYELLTDLAKTCLANKTSVILDSVCGRETIRAAWQSVAEQYEASFIVIECICSDKALHRTKLESRKRDIPNWHELKWDEVERVATIFEPWKVERLVVDSVDDLDKNVVTALDYISSSIVTTRSK